jgi:hypothetical protein
LYVAFIPVIVREALVIPNVSVLYTKLPEILPLTEEPVGLVIDVLT